MKQVLYSNYNLYDRFDDTKQMIMDEYPELCTVEVEDSAGNIIFEPDDNKVWDFIYDDDQLEWDDFYRSLKRFFANNEVMIFGTIGRWDGICSGFDIGKFEEVFNNTIKDCDYIEFAEEDGHLFLTCSHHDGTNHTELKLLNDKGYELYDNWEYGYGKTANYDVPKMFKLLNNNLYSRLPHFAKYIYG